MMLPTTMTEGPHGASHKRLVSKLGRLTAATIYAAIDKLIPRDSGYSPNSESYDSRP
jgi:hypothetical protein